VISVESLKSDLRCLGVEEGDCLLVRVGLRSVGSSDIAGALLIEALLDVLGPKGTLIGLAHSGVYDRSNQPKRVMNRQTAAITGGFANILLSRNDAFRSSHPTHSIVAIGHHAENICMKHGPKSACFSFVSDLLDLDAKMALIGCVWSGPGFSTTDFELHTQGFTRHSFKVRKHQGSWYEDKDGTPTWFERDDDPGCSRGYSNLYASYLRSESLSAGRVGSAFSLLVTAHQALRVDREEITANPRIVLCSDPLCFSCRFSRSFNKRGRPLFVLHAISHLARTRLTRGGK